MVAERRQVEGQCQPSGASSLFNSTFVLLVRPRGAANARVRVGQGTGLPKDTEAASRKLLLALLKSDHTSSSWPLKLAQKGLSGCFYHTQWLFHFPLPGTFFFPVFGQNPSVFRNPSTILHKGF